MNKKGEEMSFLRKMITMLLILAVAVFIIIGITKLVKPLKNCPEEDCTTKCEGDTKEVGRDCKTEGMICCQTPSGFLGIKQKTDETPSPPSTTPSTATSSKIRITLNDDSVTDISQTSSRTLVIGKSYAFHISAEGAGVNNCKILLLDANGNKVSDSRITVSGTSDSTNCQTQTVTITPNALSLNGGSYQLKIALFNSSSTPNHVVASSNMVLSMVSP